MNIPALGPLKTHPQISEWLVSEPIAVSYFDGKKLTFTLDGPELQDEAEINSAVTAFLSLGAADRQFAAQYVYANFRHIAELVDDSDLECKIGSESDVWQHVQPSEVFVSRRHRREKAIYVQITAECAWEPEHGLQLIYRYGNQLSRVSEQDGHLTHTDAYDLPEADDIIVEGPKVAANTPVHPNRPWWKLW